MEEMLPWEAPMCLQSTAPAIGSTEWSPPPPPGHPAAGAAPIQGISCHHKKVIPINRTLSNLPTREPPAPLQKCVGDFCCVNFGGFCRGFSILEDFSGHFFPQK